jgi:hypothetical protein
MTFDLMSRSGTSQAKQVAMVRMWKHLQAVPSVKKVDIVSLLWARDQDGPLLIGTGKTVVSKVCYIWQ